MLSFGGGHSSDLRFFSQRKFAGKKKWKARAGKSLAGGGQISALATRKFS